MITNWKDITLREWAQLRKADALKDEGDRTIAIIAALADLTPDEVTTMPIRDYLRLRDQAAFVTGEVPEPTGRVLNRYKIGRLTLVPSVDINKWTAIQFIDFQNLTEQDEDLVRLLSVVLIPDGCTYGNGYNIADVHAALWELPLLDAREVLYFFAVRSLNSALRGLRFSTAAMKAAGVTNWKMRRAIRRLLRAFADAGAGYIVSTLSPHPLGDPGQKWSK